MQVKKYLFPFFFFIIREETKRIRTSLDVLFCLQFSL